MSLFMVVSGGQTGVDRAALDAAMALHIPVGGWCPKGRFAEDGPIGPAYPLSETGTSYYAERTRKNIIDSDGTLIIAGRKLTGGSLLTANYAKRRRKPLYITNIDNHCPAEIAVIQVWIGENEISRLNVAGPRESTYPGIYQLAFGMMTDLLESLA